MTGEQQAHPILDRHSVETPLLLPPAPLLQWGAAKDGASASASMSMCTPVPDRSTRSNRPLAFTAASRSYPCAAARGNKGSQGGSPLRRWWWPSCILMTLRLMRVTGRVRIDSPMP